MHDGRRPVVVFSGGGTGGHLYPALAVAAALRELRPDVRVVFLGARRGIEARVLPERGEEHRLVPIRGVARGRLAANLGVPWAVLRSLWGTWRWYRDLRPELVVVTGGYAGAPAGIVAPHLGVPLVLQEQNAVPGITTRFLARRADQVHLAYPEAAKLLPEAARSRVRDTGNPVRPPAPRGAEEARGALGLELHRPVVLVTGGSQGSLALNQAVLQMVQGMAADGGEGLGGDMPFQLLWVTGPRHEDTIRRALGAPLPQGLHIHGYLDDMPVALEAADLTVSRAGAMSTSEFLAWGLPAVLVPLPTAAADHQTSNAQALESAGCAVHLPQSSLDGEALQETVKALLRDPERMASMRAAALERARPDAAREIARELLAFLPPAEVAA